MDYKLKLNKETVSLSMAGFVLGDEDIITELKQTLDKAIEDGANKCIIDLSEVEFMSSSGLGLLISILTKFRNKGGDVELINISEHVKTLLLITKLNSIFDLK